MNILHFFTADFISQERNENRLTYSLPHGWKKIGYQRQEGERKGVWDFHVFSPCGRRFRSNPEIDRYLDQNPEVKCDRNVTNTSKSSDLNSPTRKIEIFAKTDKLTIDRCTLDVEIVSIATKPYILQKIQIVE